MKTDVMATVVVEFGDGADSGALVVVELDDMVNLDRDGKPKTRFFPGDEPGFIVHYDQAALRIGRVSASSGQVVDVGAVTRARTAQVNFPVPGERQELPHIPAGQISWRWYGNAPAIGQDGRSIVPSGDLPAIGDADYTISCRAYRLIPPPLDLSGDETWPVLVVVTMEDAS